MHRTCDLICYLTKRLHVLSRAPLLILTSLLIFSPLIDGGTTHLAVMGIRLMILLLLAVYLLQGVRNQVLVCSFPRIGPAVLVYLGIATVSAVVSPYTNQSRQWLVVLLSYAVLLYLFMSFIIIQIIQWDHVFKLLIVLSGMGLFEASLALLQVKWYGQTRPSGTFFNPNFLAGYLATIWTIVLGCLFYVRLVPGAQNKVLRSYYRLYLIKLTGAIIILGVLLMAIVQTGSRGGLLALLVGTSIVTGLRFGFRGISVLLLMLLLCLMVPNPLHDRLWAEHTANPVSYARWQIWQGSLHAVVEHPFGVGLGLFQYIYPRYALPIDNQIARFGKIAQTAHNEYLQMAVELGICSLVVFGWGVARVAQEAIQVLKLQLQREQRGVIVGVSAGSTGILTHAAVDSNLHQPALAILLILCVGIILSARPLAGGVTQPFNMAFIKLCRARFVWVGVGLAMVVVLMLNVARLGFAWVAFEEGSRAAARQDFIRAIANYRTAIALDPGKTLYHSSLAAAHFQVFQQTHSGSAAQATIDELQLAIALNPIDGRLFGLLGHVYVVLSSSLSPSGPYRELQLPWLRSAISAYTRAAELEPFTPFYQVELGRLYLEFGEQDRAEATVRHVVEMEPNFLPGREFLAKLYLTTHRIDLAAREYEEILMRKRRYTNWPKDAFEERYLRADVMALRDALERERPRL